MSRLTIKPNKKAVLPQGNRAMPQVFFSVEVRQKTKYYCIIALAWFPSCRRRSVESREDPCFRLPHCRL